VKVDLGAEQLSVDPSLPDVDLTKYFKTPNDSLLIFDDLERCALPISEVLGYINSFVERDKFKTILIANEAEIIAREERVSREKAEPETDNLGSYSLIKEKLIGQTLEVRSSAPEALDCFLEDIQNTNTRRFLEESKLLVLELHAASRTENLRLLKHALWDYERLARNFTTEYWSNQDAMKELLNVCIVLAIEVRRGALKRQDFPSLEVNEVIRLMRAGKSEDVSVAGSIARRYPMVRADRSAVKMRLLANLLFEGWLDLHELTHSLDSSPYYAAKTKPAWLVAWAAWDVPEEDFSGAVDKVEAQFRKREFQNNCELLHIIGLRFFFSKIGAIDEGAADVTTQCVACLDDLLKADQIEELAIDELFKGGELFCFDRQVMSADTIEFKSVFAHFKNLVESVKAKRLPDHGRLLMDQLTSDSVIFFQLLCANNVREAVYYNVPVLAAVPVDAFVSRLLDLEPSAQGTVFSTLKERYRTGLLGHELRSEREWLSNVSSELIRRAAMSPPLSRFRLEQRIASKIDPILRNDA